MDIGITFQQVVDVTTSPVMITAVIFAFLLVLLLYIVIGVLVPSSSYGKKRRMIQTSEFWIGFIIWVVIFPIFYVLLVLFPIWLKLFS